jgi:hypothetical protein
MPYGLLRSPYWTWRWRPFAWRSWLLHYAELGEPSASSHYNHGEPSASSHFNHRVHCGWICNSSSNVFVRDPFLCYIPHPPPTHPAKTAMVRGFQFGPICFFQCPAFTSPEGCIDDNRLIEPVTDIDRDLLQVPVNCVFMEPNSFLACLIRSVISAVYVDGKGNLLFCSLWTSSYLTRTALTHVQCACAVDDYFLLSFKSYR